MRLMIFLIFLLLFSGCQKEKVSFSENVSETFYVENAGASMRVLVEGNTASKTFVLFIHGGPGISSYFFNTDYISGNLEDKYAIVYWDERNTGGSQGNGNANDLNLNQMVEDLRKVIQVLKYRYGQEVSVFLMGHSFGGLIASAFITKSDYQTMIKGFINADGTHNYPLNDTLTRNMLLSVGEQQVALKKNVTGWTKIIDYCKSHTGNFTLKESTQLDTYATEAEKYISGINQMNYSHQVIKYAIKNKIPLTSVLSNLLYTSNSNLIEEIAKAEFSSSLYKVTIPVLLIWGKYDFICPAGLGDDFLSRISSTDKAKVVSSLSGHNIIWQDEKFFCDEVASFVNKFK
jgi:pimeloyl-ACP methyl ester carboxylesterase